MSFQQPEWVEPRDYQQRAVQSWAAAGGQGVLEMATGTGKTVTSLLTASHVAEQIDGEMALVIAVPYQHLVDQWAEDVRDFGGNPILAYESRKNWQERLEGELAEFDLGVRDSLVVITTHTTFASANFQRVLSRVNRDRFMLIADEVHHMGRLISKSLFQRPFNSVWDCQRHLSDSMTTREQKNSSSISARSSISMGSERQSRTARSVSTTIFRTWLS